MLPLRQAPHKAADGWLSDPELRRNFSLGKRLAEFLDLLALFISEWLCAALRRIGPFSSTLSQHVPYVIRLSAQEQVVGIHASRVVALVEDSHAIRDFSSVQDEAHPVRVLHASLTPTPSDVPIAGAAISAREPVAGPQPTPIWLDLVLLLEANLYRCKWAGHKKWGQCLAGPIVT